MKSICLLHLFMVTAVGEEVSVLLGELTSGTQEAPAHVNRRGEEAVPLATAVVAADHDVMREDDTACRHAAVSRVIGQRAADTTHQAPWERGQRGNKGTK